MADFDVRLQQLANRHQRGLFADQPGRQWDNTEKSRDVNASALRSLALRKYMDAETYSYSPELHGTDPDATSYLKDLWDNVHPDDQRSLLEEDSFKRKTLRSLGAQ